MAILSVETFPQIEPINTSSQPNKRIIKRPSRTGASFKREYQKLAEDILSGKRQDPLAKLLEGVGLKSIKKSPNLT